MKNICVILFLIIITFTPTLYAQTVYGKLVDENSNGLADINLQLFIGLSVYDGISNSSGEFTFNVVLSVDETYLPEGFLISNNYPNPFNPKTRLGISLPQYARIKASVYNIIGEKVVDDFEQSFEAGVNYIDIELNGLPDGIYFTRITIDDKYIVTKKMMLIYGSQHLSNASSTSRFRHNMFLRTNELFDTEIDSLVATSQIVGRNAFYNLPAITSQSLDLGNLIIERFCPGSPTVDYLGKTYNTVKIGEQCWLKENLDVGIMISGTDEMMNNSIIEKYCYDDNTENCEMYGGLYQWNEAMQYTTIEGVQGICPDGWHMPTYNDYESLAITVSFSSNKLKAIGQGTGNGVGTNVSGFTGLLNGYRITSGEFININEYAHFWSSKKSWLTGYSHFFRFSRTHDNIDLGYTNIEWGFCVRCIKDQ